MGVHQGKPVEKPPKMYEIPLGKIDNGLLLIKRNIQKLAQDTKTLLDEGSDHHAIVLAIFAFEELAKYSELKKCKESALEAGDRTLSVDSRFISTRGVPECLHSRTYSTVSV